MISNTYDKSQNQAATIFTDRVPKGNDNYARHLPNAQEGNEQCFPRHLQQTPKECLKDFS